MYKTKKSQAKDYGNYNLEEFNRFCDVFLDKLLSSIIKTHAALKTRAPLGRRYTNEIKQFALMLYFVSPKAYNLLSKLLTLPSRRTLQRMTENIYLRPGLNNKLKALEIKAKTMKKMDKHCLLCIDEMSLKSNLFYRTKSDEIIGFEDIGSEKKSNTICKNALVIMARGLYTRWKQPIAYFFVESQMKAADLRNMLEECIEKLIQTGLIVEGIASDMGSNFLELSKSLGVDAQNAEFVLAGKNFVYIFDPCHLIKATRNNLLKHVLLSQEKKTSWTFVEGFYKKDKEQFYRSATKLTNSHIYPSSFQKMRVSLASQVISRSIVTGMNVYMTLGKVFEGSQFQTKFLNDALQTLLEMKIFDKNGKEITKRVKFTKCWAVTIQALLKLWEQLSKGSFKYLKTRRINTDCIENFFGSVRQQSGNNFNPTPIQFQNAFRKLFCTSCFHTDQMNCQEDLDQLLLINFNTANVAENIFNEEHQSINAITLPNYSYRNEKLTTQNAFNYVCGYLIKKALKNLDVSNLLIHLRAFTTETDIYGALKSPPELFVNFIYQLEKIFISKFENISIGEGISHQLVSRMKQVKFVHPCSEFPKSFIVKFVIQLKIFYTLKYSNRDLQTHR
nr:unnamed protein product [Callosobruchus analis]